MTVYVFVAFCLLVLYLIQNAFLWPLKQLLSKNILSAFKESVIFKDDLYECVNFTALRLMLKESKSESAKLKKIKKLSDRITPSQFRSYSKQVRLKTETIEKAIRKYG